MSEPEWRFEPNDHNRQPHKLPEGVNWADSIKELVEERLPPMDFTFEPVDENGVE